MATRLGTEVDQDSKGGDEEVTDEQQERAIKALEGIASALHELAVVQQNRFAKDFPQRVAKPAVIERLGDDKKEQFSDKGTEQWFEETEAATSEGKSRFQKRFEDAEAGDSGGDAAKGSGTPTAWAESGRNRARSKDR